MGRRLGLELGLGLTRRRARVSGGGEAPAPMLGALTLSGELQVGAAASGEILGATAGSTITDNIPGITVNSAARTYSGTPTEAGSFANGLVETLAEASNSPRNSAVAVEEAEDMTAPAGYSVAFDAASYQLGADADDVTVSVEDAEVGADYSLEITSSGGGTPVTANGAVVGADFDITGLDLSGLTAGTLTASLTLTDAADNEGDPATDTATLEAEGAASVPAQFAGGDWSVTDRQRFEEIRISLTALPNEGASAITAVEYRIGLGGDWTALSDIALGDYDIIASGSHEQEITVYLRAVNAIGAGADSAGDTVTPTYDPEEHLGSDLLAWFDADDAPAAEGAGVASWTDRVGGVLATQGTGANRPIWSATSFNGGTSPGVTFDGTNDYLDIAAITGLPAGASQSEEWALFENTAAIGETATGTVLSYGSNSSAQRAIERVVATGINRLRGRTASTTVQVTGAPLDGPSVARVQHGANIDVLGVPTPHLIVTLNGADSASVAVTPSTTNTRRRIGANAAGTAASFLKGVVAVVAHTLPLSVEKAERLTAYLNARRVAAAAGAEGDWNNEDLTFTIYPTEIPTGFTGTVRVPVVTNEPVRQTMSVAVRVQAMTGLPEPATGEYVSADFDPGQQVAYIEWDVTDFPAEKYYRVWINGSLSKPPNDNRAGAAPYNAQTYVPCGSRPTTDTYLTPDLTGLPDEPDAGNPTLPDYGDLDLVFEETFDEVTFECTDSGFKVDGITPCWRSRNESNIGRWYNGSTQATFFTDPTLHEDGAGNPLQPWGWDGDGFYVEMKYVPEGVRDAATGNTIAIPPAIQPAPYEQNDALGDPITHWIFSCPSITTAKLFADIAPNTLTEIRCRIPDVIGTWPAGWNMVEGTGIWPDYEFDLFESFRTGEGTFSEFIDELASSTHRNKGGNYGYGMKLRRMRGVFDPDGFNTWQLWRTPDWFIYALNGTPYMIAPAQDWQGYDRSYVILDIKTGKLVPLPVNTAADPPESFSVKMHVEFVKVWGLSPP